MSKIRVGVVRGGPSLEYEISLKTGAAVLSELPEEYEPVDILITKNGTWHIKGLPVQLAQVKRKVEVVFNALHGEFGEDGTIQKILDDWRIPYTGSGRFSSNLAMNKILAKELAARQGIKTPLGLTVKRGEDIDLAARNIFSKISPPWVIKPVNRGSSIGLFLASNFNQLANLIWQGLFFTDQVLVEEYLTGQEATAGVIDYFRGQRFYALPPIEIRPPQDHKIFDYQAKYSGITEEICPGCFAPGIKESIEDLAVRIHESFGLRHYSRSDFIVTKRGIYFLEVNTLPGLTVESLLPKAVKAVGSNYSQFLDHIIKLALV